MRRDSEVASRQEARPQPGTTEAAKPHTPGPWVLLPSSFSPRIFIMQANYGPDYAAVADVRDRRDAHLIAAAPELLAALKETVESLEQTLRWRGEGWECSEDDLLGNARAAIAKAEGRS
jgi:hypothetical protein